ncbi:MAG: DUF481 domain-containing protein [Polyangiales bacterium]
MMVRSLAAAFLCTPGNVDADDLPAALAGTPACEASADDSLVVADVQRAASAIAQQIETGKDAITLRFADTRDWIRTASGEWVRGAVDWMRDDLMEFDSDGFGPLELHMRDVDVLHSPRANTYVFEDRTALRGKGFMTKDRVVVETEDGIQVRPRESLWAIIEGGARELDYWSATLDLGLSANRGNSNQVDFILSPSIVREDRRTLHELAYTLVLGRAEGEQTVSRHIVLFRSDVWITERLFVNPVVGQLLSDRFQDIRFRAQPAAGVGVRFLHTPNAWWDISLGLGYQYLKLVDPLLGVQNPQNDGIVRLATRARFDITGDIYLLINWATNLTFTTIGNTNHTGTADLFIEVTNILSLNASFLYLRTEEPPPRADGTFPGKNDYLLIFGVALQLG